MNSVPTAHLLALTPAPGHGKRQLQTEADLVTATTAILQRYEVEGLLTCTFERQEIRRIRYVGRGAVALNAHSKKRSRCAIN